MPMRAMFHWSWATSRSPSSHAEGSTSQSTGLYLESSKAVNESTHIPSTEWRPMNKMFGVFMRLAHSASTSLQPCRRSINGCSSGPKECYKTAPELFNVLESLGASIRSGAALLVEKSNVTALLRLSHEIKFFLLFSYVGSQLSFTANFALVT